ncbi:hypothetical protein [Longimicrobium sp.]|uniref:hypothetical protein n=1 Tax=Longimicrobium sp. TaxID=2029185 RepID=UPI002E320C9E|nr:hypothetical protein [Longimicrobium sp.]HEX6037287.1 hypothetical protein [Longimicrobium sp.]
MGTTYANITLRGPTQAQVIEAAQEQGMTCFVSPTDRGVTVVYDARCEDEPDALRPVTRWLSRRLACAAWGVFVFDSDVFQYVLCRDGEVVDEYDSRPGYPSAVRGQPRGGSADVLCREMQLRSADVQEVGRFLHSPNDDNEFRYAMRRHGGLMDELGHPDLAYTFRFSDFWMEEDPPEGYEAEQFILVGDEEIPAPYAVERQA